MRKPSKELSKRALAALVVEYFLGREKLGDAEAIALGVRLLNEAKYIFGGAFRMTHAKANIDSASVQSATDHATGHAQEVVRSALRYLADPDRKERLGAGQCKRCFYIWNARIGGAAITMQPCAICSEEVMYGSTATDKLCLPCATKHEICRQCGGDLLMRPRRIL